jgi:two-component system, response regulator PdtaR
MPTALIIEDEALIALDLQAELQNLSIDVLGIARTGDEALGLLRGGAPDLAVVDLMLSGSAGGATIAEALRARRVKVLIVSGGDAAQAARNGHAFLSKPWSRDDLNRAIGALAALA